MQQRNRTTPHRSQAQQTLRRAARAAAVTGLALVLGCGSSAATTTAGAHASTATAHATAPAVRPQTLAAAAAVQPQTLAATASAVRPQTLAAAWREVRGLLQAGDSPAALEALDRLASRFAQEPEFLAAQPELLPLYADLCLANQRAGEAAELYRRWLELPSTAALLPQRVAVLGALASACEQTGDTAGTLAALQTLIGLTTEDDARNQLARLRSAELHAQTTGGTAEALRALRTLSELEGYPSPLRTQARLKAVYLALQNNDEAAAATLLLTYAWKVSQMPELAQLSFAAGRIGEHLLNEGQPLAALKAMDLIVPQPQLVQLQRLRRDELSRALATQRRRQLAGDTQAAAAVPFLSRQLEQIDLQLEFLSQQPDTTAALLYAKAEALLQAEHFWQAAIAFSAAANAAETADSSDALALQAQYNRLLALHRAGRNERLQAEADAFAEAFPQHPLNRAARSLQVENLLQAKRYAQALQRLDALAANAPQQTQSPQQQPQKTTQQPAPEQHTAQQQQPLQRGATTAARDLDARLHFQRGYANAFLGRYAQARTSFATAHALARQPLLNWAAYWCGQADMLAADYSAAQQYFARTLPQMDTAHPAAAHARFSHAQALYATGATEQAHAALQAFLKDFPAHEHSGNARLLLAETLAASEQPRLAPQALRPLLLAGREPWAGQAALRSGELFSQLDEAHNALAVYNAYLQAFAPVAQSGIQPTAHGQAPATTQQPALPAIANAPNAPKNAITSEPREATTSEPEEVTTSEPEGAVPQPATFTQPGAYAEVIHRATQTLHAQDKDAQAAELVSTALHTQGNNPASGDFGIVIAHAFRLGLSPHAVAKGAGDTAKPNSEISANPQQSYALWLEAARQSALDNHLPTLYARLNLELGRHYGRNGQSNLQQALLLQTVANASPADLDNAALDAVTRYLAEHNHSATAAHLAELERRFAHLSPEPAAVLWCRAQLALHNADNAHATELLERLRADWPTHPQSLAALPLLATLARQRAEPQAERQYLLALLAERNSLPADKAAALLALARLNAEAGQLAEAINYYQRLYTLYRAQQQTLVAAYMESAPLFAALGDTASARATYHELLESADISLPPQIRAQAEAQLHALASGDPQSLAQSASPASTPSLPATQALPATPLAALPQQVQQASQPPTPHRPPEQDTRMAASDSPQTAAAQSTRQLAPQPEQQTAAATTGSHADPEQSATRQLRPTGTQRPLAQPARTVQLPNHTQSAAAPAADFATAFTSEKVDDPLWQALLRSPAQVQLIYGGTLTGDIIGIADGMLHLRLRQGQSGVGETALPLERILRIDFDDAPLLAYIDRLRANGKHALAYACHKEFYAQRQNALLFLSDTSLHYFAALAAEALQRGEPLLAIRIAARINAAPDAARTATGGGRKPTTAAAALRSQLLDTELLGLWQMGLHAQAADKARAILEAAMGQTQATAATRATDSLQPMGFTLPSTSALPISVLAADALAQGDADTALELALQPIVLRTHSATTDTPHLATAYAIAMAAAAQLQQDSLRSQLLDDAQAQNIRAASALDSAAARGRRTTGNTPDEPPSASHTADISSEPSSTSRHAANAAQRQSP